MRYSVSTLLSRRDVEAMKWLNIAYEKKEAQLVFMGVDPLWDPIRDDPRFQDLLHRMNFPE